MEERRLSRFQGLRVSESAPRRAAARVEGARGPKEHGEHLSGHQPAGRPHLKLSKAACKGPRQPVVAKGLRLVRVEPLLGNLLTALLVEQAELQLVLRGVGQAVVLCF